MGAASRVICQSTRKWLNSLQVCLCNAVTSSGVTCQMASLGETSRNPPPANPHPTDRRMAIHSPAANAGSPTRHPTIAPA